MFNKNFKNLTFLLIGILLWFTFYILGGMVGAILSVIGSVIILISILRLILSLFTKPKVDISEFDQIIQQLNNIKRDENKNLNLKIEESKNLINSSSISETEKNDLINQLSLIYKNIE